MGLTGKCEKSTIGRIAFGIFFMNHIVLLQYQVVNTAECNPTQVSQDLPNSNGVMSVPPQKRRFTSIERTPPDRRLMSDSCMRRYPISSAIHKSPRNRIVVRALNPFLRLKTLITCDRSSVVLLYRDSA